VAYVKKAGVQKKESGTEYAKLIPESEALAPAPILVLTELLAGTVLYRLVPH
jgi:hypothetical protein